MGVNAAPRRRPVPHVPPDDGRRYAVRCDPYGQWYIWDAQLGRVHATGGERVMKAHAAHLNDIIAQGLKLAQDN